jgi:ABC-type amino acid transport substrate-binding protein
MPSRYFALRFHATNGSPVGYWVPAAKALDLNGVWTAVSPDQATLLARQTSGLASYVPRVDWAWVGSRLVKRGATASSYLRLYTIGTPLDAVPAVGFLTVELVSFQESPWYTSGSSLMVSRTGAYLLRDGKPLKIPLTYARLIRAGRPLPLQG